MGWNGTFDDSGASEGGMPPPGAYVIEISDAQTCESKKGDGMLKLKMKMLDRDWHVYDNLMLTGKGAGMGKKKAEAFGITLVKGEKVDEARFIGLRARVHLAHGSYGIPGDVRLYIACCHDSDYVFPGYEAVSITEEERSYEVEEPVVPWIKEALRDCSEWTLSQRLSAAYRSEVCRRAREAALRIPSAHPFKGNAENETIIREAFLSPE